MNKQDTFIYYMIHNRTKGRIQSELTYADYPIAMEEARRLTRTNPGVEFVIMKAYQSAMVKLPEPTITMLG